MASPKYTLTYFNAPGRAEALRLAFVVGDIAFEDKRIDFQEWAVLKPSTPLGSIPMLDVDGKKLCQSNSILRYVGKLSGVYPTDPFHAAKADELADACEDFNSSPNFFPVLFGPGTPEEKKAKFEEHSKDGGWIAVWATKINNMIKANGTTKFAISDNLTTGDLKLFCVIHAASNVPGVASFSKYDKIHSVFEAVGAHPKIAAYYAAKKQ